MSFAETTPRPRLEDIATHVLPAQNFHTAVPLRGVGLRPTFNIGLEMAADTSATGNFFVGMTAAMPLQVNT